MLVSENLTPMLRMTDAEIDSVIRAGLYGRKLRKSRRRKECEYRREECHYDRYSDDWEREGDD